MLVPLVSGRKLFGRVDHVRGFFYVATEFSHAWYCPLIPRRTVIVLQENAEGWQGVLTRLSLKSILVAWTFAATLLVWTIGGTIAVVLWTDPHTETIDKIVSGAAAGGSLILWLACLILPTRVRPSHRRAIELANLIQLSPEEMSAPAAHYS